MPSNGTMIHDCKLPAQPEDPTSTYSVRCTACNWGWRWNPTVRQWFRADPARNDDGGPLEDYYRAREYRDRHTAAVA